MAIPGTPQQFYVQTQNQQILVSWALSAGATSYVVERSLDKITFTQVANLTGTPLATSYIDTSVLLGVEYFYRVAAVSAQGQSPYTQISSAIPVKQGEMSLAAIRRQAQERADRVNSNFVSLPEWNVYINQAQYELYDLLITTYEDYSSATPVQFVADGSKYLYPLPDGSIEFNDGIDPNQKLIAPPMYKLLGVDLALQNANNAYVTIDKFNFSDRNRFVFPNTASTIYGVFNLRYRVMGNNIQFIPTPSAGQSIRLWYVPRLKALLADTDTTDIGISGWIEYVIVRAAKYALDKEESDTSKLDQQILFLKSRIEESAANRDAGQPDTISDTRSTGGSGWGTGGFGSGFNGPSGGF